MKERNLNKFFNNATPIWEEPAESACSIGYASKFLVQTTFPHSDPGNIHEITRVNGREAISLRSGFVLDDDGVKKNVGLPFGIIPRLILVWLSSEITKTKSKEVCLGKNIRTFMEQIGINHCSGGKNGSITRTKEQMLRLFLSSFYLYRDKQSDGVTEQFATTFQISKCSKFWWEDKDDSLLKGVLLLDDDFFLRATESIVPIDLRVIRLLKTSPIALDVYCWLTYRFSYLKKKTRIPWRSLMVQFGTGFEESAEGARGFKRRVEIALKKINTVWPINVECHKDFLTLEPTRPHIRKKNQILLKNI